MAAYVEDTIAAIATARGPGAISILRISGKGAIGVARRILRSVADRPVVLSDGDSHRARLVRLVRPQDDSVIDEGLAVPMLGPRSYTGEDTVEIHCHGGGLVADLALRAALRAGARAARPGEFTERAFLNGRLDLCQAEAVADMISATSEAALEAARKQLDGELSRAVLDARERILDTRALVEAHLDFPEEDLPPGVGQELLTAFGEVGAAIDALAESYARGRMIRDGLRVVLAGKPNVGKSSLMNALLGRERALVSAQPGTTRDYLEEPLALGTQQLLVCDTAGFRNADDDVERAGVERSRDLLANADVVVLVADGSTPLDDMDTSLRSEIGARPIVAVRNKSDLPAAWDDGLGLDWLSVSAKLGTGIGDLAEAVSRALPQGTTPPEGVVVTNARHHEGLVRARGSLERGAALLSADGELDLVAAELQQACAALDELVGRSDVEDVLDRVFSRFCVGK